MLNLLKDLLAIALGAAASASPLNIAYAAAPDIADRSELLIVYERAADAGRFDEALRHAVAGCEQLRAVYLCKELADLPLQIARQGIVVPPQYGSELKRVADAVCLSGKPLINSDGADVTGFVCGYYAQQFARLHGPLHQGTFLTRAWQYLDAIHDPVYANRLFQVACKDNPMQACVTAAALAPQVNRRLLEETAARDERDTPDKLRAIAVCGTGFVTKETPDPAVACEIAYTHAFNGGDYGEAMRYALLGCEKYLSSGLCRRAGGLPMVLGNRGITVPSEFAAGIRRAANTACLSGKRIKAINGVDVTARECMHFARFFGLAKDPEYIVALAPEALRFYETLYAPERAAQFYIAGCERLGSAYSCQLAREAQTSVARAGRSQ